MTKSVLNSELTSSSPRQSGTSLSENETERFGASFVAGQVAGDRSPSLVIRISNFFRHSELGFRISRFPLLLLLFTVALYTTAHLLTYLSSAAGRFPMLDGAENMELAQQI